MNMDVDPEEDATLSPEHIPIGDNTIVDEADTIDVVKSSHEWTQWREDLATEILSRSGLRLTSYVEEKQGYCEFFAWFDEIFEYVMDDVVEGQRLASVDTGAGNKGVVSLNNDLDERVKQLEDFLWKKDEDNQFVKKHNVFYFLRGVIVGALIGVVEFCIFVVAV
ncbi:hypothetical protein S83_063737 [Arachis hypogaea]